MELPCGVQYKVILQGKGPVPTAKSMVEVHYKDTLINGTVFDNSFSKKKSESFKVNEVIDIWQEV